MSIDYSHVIIGAGAVGLAIGSRLAQAGYKCLIVEKNHEIGSETSSRNSEVVHAGLYYPHDSLKMKLCLRGKQLLYNTNELQPYIKRCGKWLVAQTPEEGQYLQKLCDIAEYTGVPLNYISKRTARALEPAVIAREAVLDSPSTGIMSAHALMQYYQSQFDGRVDVSLETEVVDIRKDTNRFKLTCNSMGESVDVNSEGVINSAGLWAPRIAAMVGVNCKSYYAKGNYYSYPSTKTKVNRLVYPCPSNMGSLGTHLTIDLNGGIKFGPDFEWVEDPLSYNVNNKNLEAAKQAIKRYIDIDTEKLIPDYAGIRPKLSQRVNQFQDFHIKEDLPGFINLMGIESPGLTASMGIAELVENMLRQ